MTSATNRLYPLFDRTSGRWVIDGRDIHCGDCFQVRRDDGPWHDVRAEHSNYCGWYLIGLPPKSDTGNFDLYEARWYS